MTRNKNSSRFNSPASVEQISWNPGQARRAATIFPGSLSFSLSAAMSATRATTSSSSGVRGGGRKTRELMPALQSHLDTSRTAFILKSAASNVEHDLVANIETSQLSHKLIKVRQLLAIHGDDEIS